MYKNQLQELAQRSCFNLPSYSCIREGPDHAPRFKAAVNFNGEVFESPSFCTTLRQAEHAAAEVALHSLSSRAPSHSLAARILDETGVYKNLLQEISQRVGAPLPSYTTCRSGLGHLPVFTCTVELAGITFTGEPAKNKKQAEKNAAMAAWSSLKKLAQEAANSSNTDAEQHNVGEQEQITIARALLNYKLKEKLASANGSSTPCSSNKFLLQRLDKRRILPPFAQLSSSSACSGSKILPLFRPTNAAQRGCARPTSPVPSETTPSQSSSSSSCSNLTGKPICDSRGIRAQKFPAAGAPPYVPVRQLYRSPSPTYHHAMGRGGMAPPVTIRTAVPVFSAPPMQQHGPGVQQLPSNPVMGGRPLHLAPAVHIRQAVPVFAAPSHVNRPPSTPPTPTGPMKEQGFGIPGGGGNSSSMGGNNVVATVQHSDEILPIPPAVNTTLKEAILVTTGPGPGSEPNMEPQLQLNVPQLPEISLPQPVTYAAKGPSAMTSTLEQQQQQVEKTELLKQVFAETIPNCHASTPDITATAPPRDVTPGGSLYERALLQSLEHLSIKSNKNHI